MHSRISIKNLLLCALCVLGVNTSALALTEVEAEGRAAGDQRTAIGEAMPKRTSEANSGGVLATFSQPPKARPRVAPEVEAHVEAHVELSDTDKKIITLLDARILSQSQIMSLLGYRSRTGNFKRALERLSALSLIERTIPDKPKSRLQKYRLTAKGRALLEKSNHTT